MLIPFSTLDHFLQDLEPLLNEDTNLMLHLQRFENTLSLFAEESDKTQLFAHLGRMALEFNRLASKVHKNEQKTSILQVRGLLVDVHNSFASLYS